MLEDRYRLEPKVLKLIVAACIVEALYAVRDVSDEQAEQREALHQSLLRVIKTIQVWPESHAVLSLHSDESVVLLPLSEKMDHFTSLASSSGQGDGLRFKLVA